MAAQVLGALSHRSVAVSLPPLSKISSSFSVSMLNPPALVLANHLTQLDTLTFSRYSDSRSIASLANSEIPFLKNSYVQKGSCTNNQFLAHAPL